MRAALACGAVARRGRFDQLLVRRQLPHAVQDSVVGGHDVGTGRALHHRLEQAAGGSHHIGLRHHRLWAFRVDQDHGTRVIALEQFQLQALEFIVHDAGALPQQHVGAGFTLDVATQVLVGRPQDLSSLLVQVTNDVDGAGTGDHPVGSRLHGGTGVGIDHHLAVGVGVTEGREIHGRATEVE